MTKRYCLSTWSSKAAGGHAKRGSTTSKDRTDMYPNKFDKELTDGDIQILSELRQRRAMFDNHLKKANMDKITFTCPSCGYPTLSERRAYEICDICNWEDDGQDDQNADEIWGGPNHLLSLTESRLIIGHRLKELQDSLRGQLISNPETVLTILARHGLTMNELADQLFDKDNEHPLNHAWNRQVEKLRRDLIDKRE